MKKSQAKKIDFPMMLEKLEDRIAPAAVTGTTPALDPHAFSAVAAGSSILLKAGQGLASSSDGGGVYFLYVQKGEALVFTTDLNGDNKVESNEITGISAGDGLKLLSFVNITGDIVTNLTAQGTLTDSDNDPSNGLDGKIVLDSHIDSITLRSVTVHDVGTVLDQHNRLAQSDYSIYGNIYAGGGLGSSTTPGITIDNSGFLLQAAKFPDQFGISSVAPTPSLGFIYTGSAVSGQYFSFGTSPTFQQPVPPELLPSSEALRGQLANFSPAAGEAGGDVNGIQVGVDTQVIDPTTGIVTDSFSPVDYHIGGILTGKGGFGAKGGDISNITLNGDVEGFQAIAGDGGDGITGGAGGSILHFAVASPSINSVVNLHTGSGGEGFIGAAGSAGTVSIDGNVNMFGQISIGLGNGGDGLNNAGSGTSLNSGQFTLPEIGLATPVQMISTYRLPGDLDQTRPFDFNGDGNSDAVYVSNNPEQLVVLFGNGHGGWDLSKTQYLDASVYAASTQINLSSAVQVGDFNGDGKLDIVTASSTGTDFSGLKTFINNGDGTFGDARYSPLPFEGGYAVTSLATGDFNHDGIIDVAATYAGKFGGQLVGTDLVVMSGIKGPDLVHSDGFFAADFQKGSTTFPQSNPDIGFAIGNLPLIMKATAMTKGDVNSDIVGILDLTVASASLHTFGMVSNGPGQDLEGLGGTGVTFAARSYDPIHNTLIYSVNIQISASDFSFLDVGTTTAGDPVVQDGIFDAVVFGLDGTGAGVLAVLQGGVDGFGNPDGSISQPDQRGVQLTSLDTNIHSVLTGDIKLTSMLSSVKSFFGNATSDNEVSADTLRAVEQDAFNMTTNTIYSFAVTGFMNDANGVPPVTAVSNGGSGGFTQTNKLNSAFDDFYNKTSDYQVITSNFAGAVSTKFPDGHSDWAIQGPTGIAEVATNSLTLDAGSGGNSLLGKGGSGGSIGSGAKTDSAGNVTASIDITQFLGAVLVTGSGGSGFLGGGNAGSINGLFNSGTHMNYATGSGGNAFLGKGGDGGSFSNLFLHGLSTIAGFNAASSLVLSTGDGGFGLQGGSGGSITGRGNESSPDGIFDSYNLSTGIGAEGITAGGNGGSITSFLGQYGDDGEPNQSNKIEALYFAHYFTGLGGTAVAGIGGRGGSLISLSPSSIYNASGGPVTLEAGSGGDGLTGGAGGAITNFINRPIGQDNPQVAFITAGNGGRGVTGAGGAGGSIQNISITAPGTDTTNTVAAGNGGLSTAGSGGAGGSLVTVTMTSEAGASLGAAGVGGDGLVAGGSGGNLTTVTLDAGGLDGARVVGMAGKGGDAYGVTAAQIAHENPTTDPVPTTFSNPLFQPLAALGSVNGKGGNGGSINGFIQPRHTDTSTDLIAGNGGSTINYGEIADLTPGVGKGGSISNVSLTADAGVLDPNVAIKDYDPNFVSNIVSDIVNFGFAPTLTSSDGNVGVLVGNKGFIHNGEAVTGGSAGSVSNFSARNIMSMVAGSVENIATITSISGVHLTTGTVLGASKNITASGDVIVHPGGKPQYYNLEDFGFNPNNSFTQDAHAGGSLADGAILTGSSGGLQGPRVFGSS